MRIHIAPFSPDKETKEQVYELFKKDPFYASYYYKKIDSLKYIKYILYGITQLYQNRTSRNMIFLARNNGKIVGMIASRFEAWGTAYFGIPMAEIVVFSAIGSELEIIKIKKMLMNYLLRSCKRKGIKHLTARVDFACLASFVVLGSTGFKIMALEGINIMDSIKNIDKKDLNLKIEKLKKGHIPQLISIAKDVSSTVKSRYYFDPNLSKDKVDNYYVENIINCCKGQNADTVIVAKHKKKVIGFAAFKFTPHIAQITGRSQIFIVLFGVASLYRKKGYATSFMYNISKYLLKNTDFIISRVYLHNIPMIRLLAKFNPYPFSNYQYCLHKWIG